MIALHVVICRGPGCGGPVLLCRLCDIAPAQYCGLLCRQRARRARQTEAAQKYQRSRRGRLKHARRQRRYAAQGGERKGAKIVTHQEGPDRAISGRVAWTKTRPCDDGLARCARCLRIGEVIE